MSAEGIDFYVDGVREGMTGIGNPVVADTDDDLMVGAEWSPVSAVSDQYFDGLIDELQIHGQALMEAQVKGLYDQAPVMHMRLDEPQNAYQFADSARHNVFAECLSPEECPMTGEAVKGKVGLAAHFDGVNNNLVLVDPNAALRLDQVHRRRLGEALRPQAHAPADPVQLLSRRKAYYRLRLQENTGVPELLRGCSPYTSIAERRRWSRTSGARCWATYDGGTLRLYVNGVKVKEAASAPGPAPSRAAPAAAHRRRDRSCQRPGRRAGRADHLQPRLSADEVAALYAYQLSWTEDRESIPSR